MPIRENRYIRLQKMTSMWGVSNFCYDRADLKTMYTSKSEYIYRTDNVLKLYETDERSF